MPLYDFRCPACGPFRLQRSMAGSSASASCPCCAGAASRLVTAPALVSRGSPLRVAQDRAAASADAPAVVGREALRRSS